MDTPITPRTRKPRTRIIPPLPADAIPQEPLSAARATPGSTKTSPLTIGLVIIILAAAIGLGVKGFLTKKGWSTAGTASSSSAPLPAADIQALVQKVASHIVIKMDETPTVATVQDPDVLRAQSPVFYKDAQAGDRLLIWSDKAVLYSPSTDRILAVLPISLPSAASPTSTRATATAQAVQNVMVEIRNGSGTAGLGRTFSIRLKSEGFPNILPPTDARSTSTYPHTIIIGSATATAAVSKLQELTGAIIKELPASEAPMKGDVLLILGADARK